VSFGGVVCVGLRGEMRDTERAHIREDTLAPSAPLRGFCARALNEKDYTMRAL
jgi:hypothetical protein